MILQSDKRFLEKYTLWNGIRDFKAIPLTSRYSAFCFYAKRNKRFLSFENQLPSFFDICVPSIFNLPDGASMNVVFSVELYLILRKTKNLATAFY